MDDDDDDDGCDEDWDQDDTVDGTGVCYSSSSDESDEECDF